MQNGPGLRYIVFVYETLKDARRSYNVRRASVPLKGGLNALGVYIFAV